jgi:hypothetical protein
MKDIPVPLCDLCMNHLSDPSLLTKLETKSEKEPLKKDNGIYLCTPCYHYFHPLCLTTFMKRELKCPVCEKEIPGFEEYES